MKLYKLLPLIAVIVISTTACASQVAVSARGKDASAIEVIRISGAGGTTDVLKGLAEEYAKTNSDVTFKFLEGSGSSGGVKGVNADILDRGGIELKGFLVIPLRQAQLQNDKPLFEFGGDGTLFKLDLGDADRNPC